MNKRSEHELSEESAPKRTFSALRHIILIGLHTGPKTINQIANDTGINWRTVENHITYLMGKEYIKIMYQTSYLKIYETSEKGKKYLSFLLEKYEKEHIKLLEPEELPMPKLEREFNQRGVQK